MSTVKIIKALEWKELKEAYKIGQVRIGGEFVRVNELDEAIKAGEIHDLLVKCADELYNGDFQSVIRAFRKNLSSQLCNMKKSDTTNHVDYQRYELLDSYTKQFVVTTTSAVGKVKTEYTIDDIVSLKGNYEELRKLYNSFADKKSKSPDKIEDMKDYEERFELIKKLKSEAKEQMDKPQVSATILAKLQSGKKLTAEESAQLINLLTK